MTDTPNWRKQLEEQAAIARLESVRTRKRFTSSRLVAKQLRPTLAKLLKENGPAVTSLAARWPEIVGPKIAKFTEPVRVARTKSGAILHLRAPSAAAPLVQHAAESIKESVHLATGTEIKSIKITQTADAKKKPKSGSAKDERTLTPLEKKRIADNLKSVQSPSVRDALNELGQAVHANTPARPKD